MPVLVDTYMKNIRVREKNVCEYFITYFANPLQDRKNSKTMLYKSFLKCVLHLL